MNKQENLIKSFLPSKIFDAHTHIGLFSGKNYTAKDFILSQKEYFPSAEVLCGNLITFPDPSLVDKNKRYKSVLFLKEQLDLFPDCCGEIIVLPDDNDEDIESLIIHPNIKGFKCYHCYADRKDTFNAEIDEYLPESAWRVADKYKMCITLHMVKDAALSDENNLSYIKQMAEKYPNAKLILAHCARGFAAWTVVEAAKELKKYTNIYYDVAAVCESPAIYECIRTAGVKRILWGSDYAISDMNGKCVSFGDGFIWIYENEFNKIKTGELSIKRIESESLLALRQACNMLDLTNKDIEDIFYNNASELFRL